MRRRSCARAWPASAPARMRATSTWRSPRTRSRTSARSCACPMRARDVELVVLDDEGAAAHAAAERLVEAAHAGASIVLTGGGTPRRAYELAAAIEPDWRGAELWWGDERCVPPEHEDSNYGMAKAALLDRLERAPRAGHRMRRELGKERGPDEYEAGRRDRRRRVR